MSIVCSSITLDIAPGESRVVDGAVLIGSRVARDARGTSASACLGGPRCRDRRDRIRGSRRRRLHRTGDEVRPRRRPWSILACAAAAPIVGRLGPSAVRNGAEMIVWGGYTRSEDVGQKSDGASYNPTTGAWRTIASSPPSVQGGAATEWSGDEILVWASNSPDGPVGQRRTTQKPTAGVVCPLAARASVESFFVGLDRQRVDHRRRDLRGHARQAGRCRP